MLSEKREKVGWKEVRGGGMADTTRRRRWRGEGDWRHGGGLGSAHCQLRHWTCATVAGSKTFGQITDVAGSRMPPCTAAPLSGYLFGFLPYTAVQYFTLTAVFGPSVWFLPTSNRTHFLPRKVSNAPFVNPSLLLSSTDQTLPLI